MFYASVIKVFYDENVQSVLKVGMRTSPVLNTTMFETFEGTKMQTLK